MHIAARLGNSDLVMLLLQHGTPVDAVTKEAYTALHVACKEGKEEVKHFLAKKISDSIIVQYILGRINHTSASGHAQSVNELSGQSVPFLS